MTSIATGVLAVVDCEAIHSGWPDQPINAYSSLAFVVAAVAVLIAARSSTARVFGGALALVGLGSLLFHGSGGDGAGWLHDTSIVWLLVVVLLIDEDRVWAGAAVVVSPTAIWAFPEADEPLAAMLVGLIVLRDVTGEPVREPRWLVVAAGLFATGLAFTLLGRTNGPLCSPDSILQPHAIWHVLAAGGLLAYGVAKGWIGRDTSGRGGDNAL